MLALTRSQTYTLAEMSELVIPPSINDLLTKKKFDVERVIPNNRFFVAKGSMPDYDYPVLFKSNRVGNGRNLILQRNHILWTKTVTPQIPHGAPFDIVPILEDGSSDEVPSWFISPFVEGTELGTVKDHISKVQLSNPEDVVLRIAELAHFIGGLTSQSIMGVDGRLGSPVQKPSDEVIRRSIVWARNDTPHVAELLQIVEANAKYLNTANAHGDFSETNIIITNDNKPVLYDGELANANDFQHYDAADFYRRLVTRAGEPELARKFLRVYLDRIPNEERRLFFSNFLALSAMGCLGNYTEIETIQETKGRQTRIERAKFYAELIVSAEILNV